MKAIAVDSTRPTDEALAHLEAGKARYRIVLRH